MPQLGGVMLTTLQRDESESQKEQHNADCVQMAESPESTTKGTILDDANIKILRFAKSERLLHWSIAGPFLVSFATGVTLALVYNPDPSRPLRGAFALVHRISGIALMIFPLLAVIKSRGDARIHFYNIRQAWIWVYDDFKWLALMGLAAVNSSIKLPEQGKFNAAEKINFMVLMTTYPLYVFTGLLMWLTHLPVLSWILHFLMAVFAAPLLLGHLYMALINTSTRPGLHGMISGHVDRHWAKHHYRRWYREHHERS
jgi:formate dehydrogenase subunit gamma